MRYAILDSGKVANIIIASDEYAASIQAVACPDGVGMGWLYNGTAFSAPPAPLAQVPQAITMRQARLALLAAGKLNAVASAIAAMPSPAKEQAAIEWEYSTTVERNRPLVLALGPALGLDSAALDALFIAAEKL